MNKMFLTPCMLAFALSGCSERTQDAAAATTQSALEDLDRAGERTAAGIDRAGERTGAALDHAGERIRATGEAVDEEIDEEVAEERIEESYERDELR